MEIVRTSVFITKDGKKFFDENEARRHEETITNTRAYKVRYSPDLNETGYFQKIGFIVCQAKWGNELWVEDWLYKEFGNRIAFVQGSSPTENWKFERVELTSIENEKVLTRIIK